MVKARTKNVATKPTRTRAAKKRKEESDVESDSDCVEEETDNAKGKASSESGLLNDCKKLFGTKDLYEILSISKSSSLSESITKYF